MNKLSAQKEIIRLVSAFFKMNSVNEKEVETKLIEPLFTILGWNFQSKDVSKGEKLGNYFPDYTFKIEGKSKFNLEAKAVGVKLDSGYKTKNFVEQALDYARRSDCTFVILTNFAELRLYSTDRKDNDGLIFKINCTDFADSEFENLWRFSRASCLKNELDKFGEKLGFKKTRIPIDKILLADLIMFRESLSKDIIKNNHYLHNNINLCDEVVQKLLDRLIFIRNCEDRGIEHNKLIALVGTKNIIRRLREEFSNTNKYGYYNSALFARHECDNKDLLISDGVISDIIYGMYESKSTGIKYNFSEIESDILGSIYEQYLSHLLNKRKKGAIGENLGKKKNQGIYYTPAYVVDYIVKHTLGEVLKGKNTKQIEGVKVLDMACGSGSFLIKCYDILEQAYLGKLRQAENKKESLQLFSDVERAKQLKGIQKCGIIENNIFGVDLDKQAVEISQLNLLLKIKEKVRLPFTNVICGDSLLDENNSDYSVGLYEQFSNVRKNQFDVIVGNPPYVDVKELDNKTVKKLFEKYPTVENRMNLYSVFVERGLELLKQGGYFGFIIPNSILMNDSYKKIRKLLLENVCLKEIVRMPDNVFEGVNVETIILIYKKDKTNAPKNECKIIIYNANDKINSIGLDNNRSVGMFKQKEWLKGGTINISLNRQTKGVLKTVEKDAKPLEYYCDLCLGLTPYDKARGQTTHDIENKIYHSNKASSKFHKPLLDGKAIRRFSVNWSGDSYIKYGNWLGAPREQKFFTEPRVLVRQIISGKPGRIFAGFANKELYNAQVAFNILIKDEFKKDINIKYLLGLINSNLFSYYHREKYLDPTKTTFQKILIVQARQFPIRIASKAVQSKMEHLCDAMIGLSTQLHKLDKLSDKRRSILNQLNVIDKKLNQEVFKIYEIENIEQEIINESFK